MGIVGSEKQSRLKSEELLALAAGDAATQKARLCGARPFNDLKGKKSRFPLKYWISSRHFKGVGKTKFFCVACFIHIFNLFFIVMLVTIQYFISF